MQFLKIFLLLTVLGIGPYSMAQQNRQLSQNDLSKSYKFSNSGLSPDGHWVTYNRHYKKGNDTLVLVHTETEHRHEIPNGQSLQFSNNSNWASFKD